MNTSDKVSYYKERSKDYIFVAEDINVKIDDDEILDLDSLDLSNNEDSWLYSSEKETSDSIFSNNIIDYRNNKQISNEDTFSQSIIFDHTDYHPSFLNSSEELSNSVISNFLKVTPANSKVKPDFLEDISLNHQKYIDSKLKLEQSPLKAPLSDDMVFKKPHDTVEKSYVLQSIVNKRFKISDFDTKDRLNSLNYKNIHNREVKEIDNTKKSLCNKNSVKLSSTFSINEKLDNLSDTKNMNIELDEKNQAKDLVSLKTVSGCKLIENNENINKHQLRNQLPLCQSTPMLLNRFLKYNSSSSTNDNKKNTFTKYRHSNEYFKEQNHDVNLNLDKNQMNISYIISSPRGSVELSPPENEIKPSINSKYSKSDDVLNSPSELHVLNDTFNVGVEDDVVSTASESSLSSTSNKCFLSAKDVQRNAELQELRLRSPVPTSYYGESSKSSEVSSSNESISTNEIKMNTKVLNCKNNKLQVQGHNAILYHNVMNETIIHTNNDTSRFNTITLHKPITNGDSRKVPVISKKSKTSNVLRNKLPPSNSISPNKLIPNMKESSKHSLVNHIKPISKKNAEDSMVVKEEIKLIDDCKLLGNQKPVSHIPRPSSRIPMLRTSTSCNRYSKSKNGN